MNNDIWPALVPLLSASIGIERAIEVIWNYIEWALLNSSRWQPSHLKSPQYIQFKSGTSMVLGAVMGILLANYTGLYLFEHLRTFAPNFLAGVPLSWDIIITGVIIGAGTKPAHDILGIVTQLKNFLGSSAIRQREAASASLADGVLKLAESESKMMINVPGIGPTRLSSTQPGIPGQEGDGVGDSPETEQSATERYVETLHNRVSM